MPGKESNAEIWEKYNAKMADLPARPSCYVVSILDGYGDLLHLIDRAGENLKLPSELQKQQFYFIRCRIIDTDSDRTFLERRKKFISDKLSSLPDDHPLNISKLGKTLFVKFDGEDKSISTDSVGFPDVEFYSKRGFIFNKPSIIHAVSTLVDAHNNHEESIVFSALEHSSYSKNDSSEYHFMNGILSFDMGFSKNDLGIFLRDKVVKSDSEIVSFINSLEGSDRDLIRSIVGGNGPELTEDDLRKFREEVFFVPAYVQDQEFYNKVVEVLQNSPISRGKRVKIFTTGDEKYITPRHSDKVEIIEKFEQYVPDNLYSVFRDLSNDSVMVCSGDKSFENVLSEETMPIFQIKQSKGLHLAGLVKKVMSLRSIDPTRAAIHDDCVRYLNYLLDKEPSFVPITAEMVQYWQQVVIPYLKQNYNYYDVIPRAEYRSRLIFELQNSTGADLEGIVRKFLEEFKEEEIVKFIGLYINGSNQGDLFPRRNGVEKILDFLPEDILKKVYELVMYDETNIVSHAYDSSKSWLFWNLYMRYHEIESSEKFKRFNLSVDELDLSGITDGQTILLDFAGCGYYKVLDIIKSMEVQSPPMIYYINLSKVVGSGERELLQEIATKFQNSLYGINLSDSSIRIENIDLVINSNRGSLRNFVIFSNVIGSDGKKLNFGDKIEEYLAHLVPNCEFLTNCSLYKEVKIKNPYEVTKENLRYGKVLLNLSECDSVGAVLENIIQQNLQDRIKTLSFENNKSVTEKDLERLGEFRCLSRIDLSECNVDDYFQPDGSHPSLKITSSRGNKYIISSPMGFSCFKLDNTDSVFLDLSDISNVSEYFENFPQSRKTNFDKVVKVTYADPSFPIEDFKKIFPNLQKTTLKPKAHNTVQGATATPAVSQGQGNSAVGSDPCCSLM